MADYEMWPNRRPINPNLSGKKADENSKASKIEGKYHVVLILKVSVAPTSFSKSVNSQYNKFVIFFFLFQLTPYETMEEKLGHVWNYFEK